jgi:glycosyltransferase involved in cell wall biosynthesis
MRVLHVVGALDAYVGGSTAAAVDTCGYLRRHGVEAAVAGTWESPRAADYISATWPDLPVYGFSRRAPRHYWHSPALRRWLETDVHSYDLVCVHGVFKFPFVDAARAAHSRRVPFIIQPHGSLDPYDLGKHRRQKAVFGPVFVRPMLERAEAILVTTDREGDRLVSWRSARPVHVLPLAVHGPLDPPSRHRFRQRFRFSDQTEVVVFLSRIDRKKGLERLLTAVARLRGARPEMRLVVVGSAEDRRYEARLRRLARRLAIDDIVTWTGLLLGADKWDALAGGDVFALPSDNENFGIVVIEALLAGTPALISDEVYLADDLRGIRAVSTCDRDAESVAQALCRMLDDRIALRQTVASERTSIVERFSPESVTDRTLELYERLIRSRSPS